MINVYHDGACAYCKRWAGHGHDRGCKAGRLETVMLTMDGALVLASLGWLLYALARFM